jgi:hypothetical protein
MVMPVPATVAAKKVPRAPKTGVSIAMTVGPLVVRFLVDPWGVVRARFKIDRRRLMIVVTLDDAFALHYAWRSAFKNDFTLSVPVEVG